MLACSRGLREKVMRTLRMYPHWGSMHTYHLEVFLRYHLNEALGEQSFSNYAPAVARAELLHRRSQYLINALEGVVDKTIEDLLGKPLGVPSTLAALLLRSKGEPQAILKVAGELRQHSRPLRDSLELLASKYSFDTPESRFEIHRAINELERQLRRDLRLENPVEFGDAVELRFIVGVPLPSVSGAKLLKWLAERRMSKRTAVLTELVRASAYADYSIDLHERLRKLSARNI
jgi:hypothetical protein